MSRLLSPALLLALLTPACAADNAGGSYGDDAGEDSGDGLQEDGELPGDLDDEDLPPTLLVACELPLPCDEPFEAVRAQGDAPRASDRCAFEAMTGGQPALVQTVADFGGSLAYLDYAIVAPGVALRQASGESDTVGRWQKEVTRCALQPAAFFTTCAAQPGPDCYDPERWVVGCEPLDTLTCPR